MPEFPAAPVPPSDFMEAYLGPAFAEAEAFRASLGDVEERLGVKLAGPGGGEWVVAIRAGQVDVLAESRETAALTLVLSVDDWCGALWEGRGGAIGKQAAALFRPGETPTAAGPGAAPSPAHWFTKAGPIRSKPPWNWRAQAPSGLHQTIISMRSAP